MSANPIVRINKPYIKADKFESWRDGVRQQKQAADAFSNVAARLGFGSNNLLEGTSYPLTRLSYDYILLQSLYRGNWIIRKAVDVPAEDMTKNWIGLITQLSPKRMKRFEQAMANTQTQNQFLTTLKWARLFGGAAAIIVIKGDANKLDKPLKLDDIEPDSYRGLIPLDRWSGIYPSIQMCTDIERPIDFGLPEMYRVTLETAKSFNVHSSRIIRFIGRDVPKWEKQVEQRWGISEVEVMYEELRKRDNTSWNIASLIFRANIVALKQKDLSQMLSGLGSSPAAQQRFWTTLQAQTQLMSNQGMMILPEEGGLDEHQYSFGGIADVYEAFKEDICGATGIPYSRMFGRTPGGLNTTNEGEEQLYYESLEAKQKRELDPQMQKLAPVIAMSAWGEVPDDLEWKWNSVRSMSSEKQAELAKSSVDSVVGVYNAGLTSPKTSLMELKQQSSETGLFTNITDEDIEKASDEPMQMGGELGGESSPADMAMEQMGEEGKSEAQDSLEGYDLGTWQESKHGRAGKGRQVGKSKGGQFAPKGMGGQGLPSKQGSALKKTPTVAQSGGTAKKPDNVWQGKTWKNDELFGQLKEKESDLLAKHPDWKPDVIASKLVEHGEKIKATQKEQESMRISEVNRVLARPSVQKKVVEAFGAGEKMGKIASIAGLPRNKKGRGALRKLLRQKGVYKENGGFDNPFDKVELAPENRAKWVPEVPAAELKENPHKALEQHLAKSKIVKTEFLGGGVMMTEVAMFENGKKGVWKPQHGEDRGCLKAYGIEPGHQAEREAGAWEVAKLCGMDDLACPCVIRDHDGAKGAILDWQEAQVAKDVHRKDRYGNKEDDILRAAAFDFVIGNADRHAGNWMVKSDGKMVLIDHGLSLPEKQFNPNNDRLMQEAQAVAKESPARVAQNFINNKEKIVKAVKDLKLPKGAAEGIERRIGILAAAQDWNLVDRMEKKHAWL